MREAENEIEAYNADEITLLDVRNPGELHRTGMIKNAINIPLDDLRDRLEEIDKSKPVYIYCAKGLRGYLSALILHHHGFKQLVNISGGFTAWSKIVGKVETVETASV